MVKICPVSQRNVNENVSRLNAFFTFVFVIVFLTSGNIWFLPVIIIDFILRLIIEGKFNPIIRFNVLILDYLKSPKILINAGPKIFAARTGLTLTVIAFLFALFGLNQAATITMIILGFFAFLEFSFGICVACKIYPYALFLNELKILR